MSSPAASSIPRPPIIAVLGHVDHGKSTLLDFIRKSNTVAGEAGGITQHVAAYEVEHEAKDGSKKRITFIDTPGHAAFKSIRARGANVADIAILVVSAEDGVKEQTLEAVSSIRASNTPMVVAITKIDKPNANVEQTKYTLLENGIYLEGLGGDVPWVAVSAKSGEGIPDLLDILLLVADIEELRADPSKLAEGFVIEAHRDPKRGIAATLIITDGSLKSGMAVEAGGAVAPLRIVEDHAGRTLREATFSTPVSVIGFDEMPMVGVPFQTYTNKKDAETARDAARRSAGAPARAAAAVSSDGFVLPVIVKADATGSLEAIEELVGGIGNEHARVHILQTGLGPVSESDVKMAVASTGVQPTVVAFGVEADASATELARQHGILIESFSIIYKLTERLEELLKEREPVRTIEEVIGRAKILKCFSSKRESHVVGGEVTEGQLSRGGALRITRNDEVIGSATLANIQAHKQDVERIDAGMQFGAQIDATFEIQAGDIVEQIVTSTNK